jgi:hypothetical protein
MTKPNQTRRKSGRAVFAVLRRPAATWFAALALLVQMIGFGAAPTAASAEQRAAAALSAAIGQQVSLCAQGEHSGGPDQSCPCCDDCALCGVAGCSAAAPLADRVIALLAPERVAPAQFPTDNQAPARPPVVFSSARPRAPPLSI